MISKTGDRSKGYALEVLLSRRPWARPGWLVGRGRMVTDHHAGTDGPGLPRLSLLWLAAAARIVNTPASSPLHITRGKPTARYPRRVRPDGTAEAYQGAARHAVKMGVLDA